MQWGKSPFKNKCLSIFQRFFCNFHIFILKCSFCCFVTFLCCLLKLVAPHQRHGQLLKQPLNLHGLTKKKMHVFWSFSFVIVEFFNVLAKKEQIVTTRLLDRVVKFFGQGTGSDLKIEQSSTLGYPSGPAPSAHQTKVQFTRGSH